MRRSKRNRRFSWNVTISFAHCAAAIRAAVLCVAAFFAAAFSVTAFFAAAFAGPASAGETAAPAATKTLGDIGMDFEKALLRNAAERRGALEGVAGSLESIMRQGLPDGRKTAALFLWGEVRLRARGLQVFGAGVPRDRRQGEKGFLRRRRRFRGDHRRRSAGPRRGRREGVGPMGKEPSGEPAHGRSAPRESVERASPRHAPRSERVSRTDQDQVSVHDGRPALRDRQRDRGVSGGPAG